MEKESFPSNNVEFNTADFDVAPAGDALLKDLSAENTAANEAPVTEEAPADNYVNLVKDALAEEKSTNDEIDNIIEKSKNPVDASLVKKGLALALAGSAILGAGCKDKNKDPKSTSDPTSRTPNTESVSKVDESTEQSFYSSSLDADRPLSSPPTAETEKTGGKHAVVKKAEGHENSNGVMEYDRDSVETESYLDLESYIIEDPYNDRELFDLDAYLSDLGVDTKNITVDGNIYVGDIKHDKVALEITTGGTIRYYIGGKAQYAYVSDPSGMRKDGVNLSVRNEDGDPEFISRMHQEDLEKALEVMVRAYVAGKTTSPFELGES